MLFFSPKWHFERKKYPFDWRNYLIENDWKTDDDSDDDDDASTTPMLVFELQHDLGVRRRWEITYEEAEVLHATFDAPTGAVICYAPAQPAPAFWSV